LSLWVCFFAFFRLVCGDLPDKSGVKCGLVDKTETETLFW